MEYDWYFKIIIIIMVLLKYKLGIMFWIRKDKYSETYETWYSFKYKAKTTSYLYYLEYLYSFDKNREVFLTFFNQNDLKRWKCNRYVFLNNGKMGMFEKIVL